MGFLISPLRENQTLSFAGQTQTTMQYSFEACPDSTVTATFAHVNKTDFLIYLFNPFYRTTIPSSSS